MITLDKVEKTTFQLVLFLLLISILPVGANEYFDRPSMILVV